MISSRQKLFREKWLWALCLAILVHIGFFLVFYLNVDKDTPTPVASGRADIKRSSMPADVGQSITPDAVKTYTVTDDTDAIKTVDPNGITQPTMNKETLSTSNLDASTSNTSNPNEVRAVQTLTEGAASASMTSALTLKERDQRDVRSTQADEALSAMSSNNNPSNPASLSKTDTQEEIKARAGLLSIDVPTQQTDNKSVKIDIGYLAAKSEVEDINSQLSAAINEVKKRNQQKIDEMQQLRDDTNNKDRQAVTSIAD